MPLVLERFSQAGVHEVYLNEALTFRFSAPLDRISVHRRSLRVLDPAGRPVAGTLDVDGATVRFLPHLASTPSLRDGGFLPGQDYRVELPGFPEHNTIVSRGGVPLRYGYRLHFRTVGLEPGRSPYLDGSPSGGPRIAAVEPRYGRLGPQDSIRLHFSEPVLPWTAGEQTVMLWRSRPHAKRLVAVPVRVALAQREDGAEITVRPRRGGFLSGETYFLEITPGLLDFGGFSLTPPLRTPMMFHCTAQGEAPRGEVRFRFQNPGWRDEGFEEDHGLLQPDLRGELRLVLLQESGSGAAGTLHVEAGRRRDVAAGAPGLSSLRRLVIDGGATLHVQGEGSGGIAAAEDVSIEGLLLREAHPGKSDGPLLRVFANGDLRLDGRLVVLTDGPQRERATLPSVWIRVGGRIRFGPHAAIRFEGLPGMLRLEDGDGVVEGWRDVLEGVEGDPEIRATDPSPPLRLQLAAPLHAVVRTGFLCAADANPRWEGVQWAGESGKGVVAIRVSGAPALAGDSSRADRSHETPFTAEVEEIRGLPFVRLEISVTLPAGEDVTLASNLPKIRDVRLLYRP